MLQQTRVQAVIPYYERFLQHFPDVSALANAPEQELLACWSGLGYYSRARNLQRAAQMVVERHGSQFPRELAAALALPGVGVYTASAILSIAYGLPLAVLDGNVARVLSRLYASAADLKTTVGRDQLSRLASGLISANRPGDFNQAMMELGATVCLPQQPRCEACPLQGLCAAYLEQSVERYPPRRTKLTPVTRRLSAVIVRDRQGRCLTVQRPQTAKWMAGFWELPMWEQPEGTPPLALTLGERLGTVRHTITNNRMLVSVFSASIRRGKKIPAGRWLAPEELATSPMTTISRKALALRDAPGGPKQ
jgi:A/G-specific adenine glycosylase